ncbi:MAG: hypothetical protein V4686_02025 [Patescibacteria group bacterium]
MQSLSNLLKNIEQGKSELQMLAETISQLAGVVIHEKDLEIHTPKGGKKLRFKISGAKKTALIFKKAALEEKLLGLGFILVL